jgi:hypothetical protein
MRGVKKMNIIKWFENIKGLRLVAGLVILLLTGLEMSNPGISEKLVNSANALLALVIVFKSFFPSGTVTVNGEQ